VTQRPDLAAARADAERANVRIRQVRAQYLPSVALSSSLAGTWTTGAGNFSPPHQISVGLRWPIFTGFRNVYDVRAAEIEAQTAQEDVRALVQQVNLQVWTSYYSLKTAEQRLVTARDLLSSAEQSVDVARSRYR